MPPYICQEVTLVPPKSILGFYPLDDELSPDIGFLDRHLRPGDVLLGVDYFGWPPCEQFVAYAAAHPEIVWVEDCTQCLWTDQTPWAPWVLYSPRKLVGVSDGGLLIARAEQGAVGPTAYGGDARLMLPELMRFEDPREEDNDNWHAAFKAREASTSAESLPISRMTVALLQRIPLQPLAEARRRNFEYLADQLGEFRRWRRPLAGVVPFGFPIAVADAGVSGAALAAERFFCSRHWPPAALPVDEVQYPDAHRLARTLLTLPCDHRYDEADLAKLVEAVRRLAQR
jgi:hypothetical protein